MKTLKVLDMHCERCVERISKALKAENIVFEVNLADKTVAVEENKTEAAIQTLDDLGFTAAE